MKTRGSIGYRASVWFGRLLIFAVGVWLLQEAPGRWVSPIVLARPSDAVETIWDWLQPHAGATSLYGPVFTTVGRTLFGLIIGTSIALVLAFLVWRFRTLARIFEPLTAILNNLPRVALVPIFILWFGAGRLPVLVFVASAAFFPMYYNVLQGLKSTERQFIESLAIMGASQWNVLRQYVFPHLREYVLSAFMISIPLTFVSAIVAEMLMSAGGLGRVLISTQQTFDTKGIYAATFVAAFIGVVANLAVIRIARRGRSRAPHMWGL
jgi:NitT/TauT family transport system permease protein